MDQIENKESLESDAIIESNDSIEIKLKKYVEKIKNISTLSSNNQKDNLKRILDDDTHSICELIEDNTKGDVKANNPHEWMRQVKLLIVNLTKYSEHMIRDMQENVHSIFVKCLDNAYQYLPNKKNAEHADYSYLNDLVFSIIKFNKSIKSTKVSKNTKTVSSKLIFKIDDKYYNSVLDSICKEDNLEENCKFLIDSLQFNVSKNQNDSKQWNYSLYYNWMEKLRKKYKSADNKEKERIKNAIVTINSHILDKAKKDIFPNGFKFAHLFSMIRLRQFIQSCRKSDNRTRSFILITHVKTMLACIITAIILVAGIVGGTIYGVGQMVDKDTITFENTTGEEQLNVVYGEELDLSSILIKYQLNSGKNKSIVPTMDMVSGYDKEKIGEQVITITYKKVQYKITVVSTSAMLDTPVVSIVDNKLHWEAIPNAETYKIFAGDTKDNLSFVANVTDTFYDFKMSDRLNYSYFSISAFTESNKFLESVQSEPLKILILDKARGLLFSDGVLTWEAVQYSTVYAVEINGVVYNDVKTNLFDLKSKNIELTSGKNIFKVYAYANFENTIWSVSDQFVVTILEPVKYIKYADGYISWDKLDNVDKYAVYINDVLKDTITNTKFSIIDLPANIYKITIVSISNNIEYVKSEKAVFSILLNFKIDVEDNKIKWPIINDCIYHIIVNDKLNTNQITTNSMDIESLINTPGDYNIQIKVESKFNILYSESNILNIKKYNKPIIRFENNQIKADNTSLSAKYYLNSVEMIGNILDNITIPGKYVVTAKYISTSKYVLESAISNELVFTKLEAPTIKIVDKKIVLDNTNNNVKYYQNGKEFDGNLNNLGEGTFEITTKYYSNESNIIESDISNKLVITRYNKPVVIIKNGTVSIDQPFSNVQYYLNNKPFDGNIKNITEPGIYKVKAKIVANDNSHLDSYESDYATFRRLPNPVLSIVNKTIKCDNTSFNVEYYLDNVLFDGKLDSNKILEGTHVIKARYVARLDNELDSSYSNEVEIIKIAKPQITVSNDKINLDSSKYNVKYYLDNVIFDGNLKGKNIEEGTHTITVRYSSPINNILDSELSNSVSITKIKAPQLYIKDGVIKSHTNYSKIIYYLDGIEFDGNLSTITKPGNYTITAKFISVENDHLDSNLSEPLVLNKISSPEISIANEKVVVNTSARKVELFLDGVKFDGDLSKLTKGTYTITAKFCKGNENELDSTISKLVVTRLPSPEISISNSSIVYDSKYNIELYLDDVKFDGVLKDISVGSHTIKAKYLGSNMQELNSGFSNECSVFKLAAPTLTYMNGVITADNVLTTKYYYNGIEFDGKYTSLPAGNHLVNAINVGDGINTITSNFSNTLKLFIFEGHIIATQIANNRLNIMIKTSNKDIRYDINVEFYKAGQLIDSYQAIDKTNMVQTISYNRSGEVSDKVKISIIVSPKDENYEKCLIEYVHDVK